MVGSLYNKAKQGCLVLSGEAGVDRDICITFAFSVCLLSNPGMPRVSLGSALSCSRLTRK